MLIRHKYYPYPVVAESNDSYIDTIFTSDVDVVKEGYNIKFSLKAEVNNDTLNELISGGKAAFVHHIECPQTCYRNAVKTDENEKIFIEHESKLNGTVQICSMIIAMSDIAGYRNPSFSSDYKGFGFNIEKGCVMGIGKQINIDISKEKDNLENTSSIFSIIPIMDPEETMIHVETGNPKKITIHIPQKTYNRYRNLSRNLEIQQVMHYMIIIPALIQVFNELKSSGSEFYMYEEYKWFKALKKACKKIDVNLDENGIKSIEPYKVAQMLLDTPTVKALKFLSECNGGDEE